MIRLISYYNLLCENWGDLIFFLQVCENIPFLHLTANTFIKVTKHKKDKLSTQIFSQTYPNSCFMQHVWINSSLGYLSQIACGHPTYLLKTSWIAYLKSRFEVCEIKVKTGHYSWFWQSVLLHSLWNYVMMVSDFLEASHTCTLIGEGLIRNLIYCQKSISGSKNFWSIWTSHLCHSSTYNNRLGPFVNW